MVTIGLEAKLRFPAVSAGGPAALAGAAVYDGFLPGIDFPREWGQCGAGYGKRCGSTLAHSAIRNLLGFSIDSVLRQDRRYYCSIERGMRRPTKHAFRETLLTHQTQAARRSTPGAWGMLTALPSSHTNGIPIGATR